MVAEVLPRNADWRLKNTGHGIVGWVVSSDSHYPYYGRRFMPPLECNQCFNI